MQTLKSLKSGESAVVTKIGGAGPVKRRIMEMGITKGTEITVRKVAPLGDPMEVNVRGYELSLRKADAELIEVEISAFWFHKLDVRQPFAQEIPDKIKIASQVCNQRFQPFLALSVCGPAGGEPHAVGLTVAAFDELLPECAPDFAIDDKNVGDMQPRQVEALGGRGAGDLSVGPLLPGEC